MNCDASAATAADVKRRDDTFPAKTRALVLTPIATGDRRLEYCLSLARDNMLPYLLRRGQDFDDHRWRNLAPRASHYLIVDATTAVQATLGFLSLRSEPDCPNALHVGDIQLEARHRNRGVGWATLQRVEDMARSLGLNELTLNVFSDNPALRLYERFGFQRIDMQFDKYKMRKACQVPAACRQTVTSR